MYCLSVLDSLIAIAAETYSDFPKMVDELGPQFFAHDLGFIKSAYELDPERKYD